MTDESQSHETAAPERVLRELARIVASPDFTRAPVMRRLLDFLVHATLEGRPLKAYAVAVDGLGRPSDFDAKSDSYPRVQVGRLRRMLDSFYAREGEAEGLRFAIPAGHYRVSFSTGPTNEIRGEEPAAPGKSRRRTGLILAAIVLIVLAVALALFWAAAHRRGAETLESAPILEFGHLSAPPAVDALEIDADAILIDALRRSWIARIRTDDPAPGEGAQSMPTYVLNGDIVDDGQIVLRLRLTRAATGELIWTGQTALPSQQGDALRDALAPLVAELVQPYGVIATDQRTQIGEQPAPGYPCILRFDQYRRERGAALFVQARDCVSRTLNLDPGDPLALAAQSFLTLDAPLYGLAHPEPHAAERSLTLARRAATADPYSAVAHITLARALRFTGDCPAAVRGAHRAVALNPDDPDLASMAGGLLMNCDDPGAEALLRRAIMLDPSPPPSFYTPLVFLALDRGDIAAARKAAEGMTPTPSANRAFYDLVLTIVAAAEGDRKQAHAIWRRIEQNAPDTARDPQATLDQWILPPRMRADAMAYLRKVGLAPAEKG